MDRREALKRTAWIMGGVVSAPAIMGVLKGCTAKPSIDWKPEFLVGDPGLIVTQVADIIIPKTDTPGAKEVGVPQFIDIMLKDCYTKEDQDHFLAGLKAFDEGAKAAHGDAFLDLTPENKLEYVSQVHVQALDAQKNTQPAPKRPFILMMKELTMLGYFTSKPGATEVLQYEAVPGAYHGCVPLEQAGNGKTWAT
jgi:gluconate 2-dehydrogenase gamma chain